MAKGTLYFYKKKLELFYKFCVSKNIDSILEIDANLIREYLADLESKGHNSGGIHGCYRALKTFLKWWEEEVEIEGWKNPINKVKTPKNPLELKDPVTIEDVKAMIDVCPKNTLTGLRNRSIFAFLCDTGIRSFELIALTINDVNLITGEIAIRMGKGRKSRTVYIGSKTKKWMKAYLRFRKDNCPALWVTRSNEPLTYWGLKAMVKHCAKLANVNPPEIHAFRRGFCLTMLRSGADIYSIQALMGHADLQIMKVYLKQTNQDIKLAHQKASPVDNQF